MNRFVVPLTLGVVALVSACSTSPEKVGAGTAADLVSCEDVGPDGTCPTPGETIQCSGGSCQCCCQPAPPKPPSCPGNWVCDSNCGSPSCHCQTVCGDGICSDGETCSSCSADCGPCSTCQPPLVSDGQGGCACPLGEPCIPVNETTSCYWASCPTQSGTCQYTKTCADACTTATSQTTLVSCDSGGGGGGSGGGNLQCDPNQCAQDCQVEGFPWGYCYTDSECVCAS